MGIQNIGVGDVTPTQPNWRSNKYYSWGTFTLCRWSYSLLHQQEYFLVNDGATWLNIGRASVDASGDNFSTFGGRSTLTRTGQGQMSDLHCLTELRLIMVKLL